MKAQVKKLVSRKSGPKIRTRALTAKKSAAKKTPAKKAASKIDREKLILEHRDNARKLARSMLRRWRVRLPYEELDSIVDLTLCESALRFSPEHGAGFMTFLFYHLRGYLVRAVSSAVQNTQFMNGVHTTTDDETIHLSPEGACFGNHQVESPETILIRKENISSTRTACSGLDSLEQEVIIRSFENDESLVDIAKSLGYSRCHISRVKRRALEQLQGSLGSEHANESTKVPLIRLQVEAVTEKRKRTRRGGKSNVVEITEAVAGLRKSA
ncbi:sigma-70 family RNA polymerase sigma factor [bacterium]|nr:sigma-70 family RNA polymerase sigma factor [bacterium]